MKIVFLDIDGVLCSPGRGWTKLKSDCVYRLNQITSESGAKIVISSTWRLSCNTNEEFKVLTDYLHSEGIQADIIGKTPTHRTYSQIRGINGRGAEIKEWLDTTNAPNIFSFVIIDDNEDMGNLRDRLVLTSHKTGIVDKNINAAIKILNRKIEN